MTLKIAVDAGHAGFGVTPGKRTPDGEYEWHFNDANADAFIQEISQYEGVRVKLVSDPTGRRDVPLKERVDVANDWGSDLYISFHHNANTGKWGDWTGTETYSYPGSSSGKRLARVAHAGAMDAYGLRDRGLRQVGFYVLKNTRMPGALIEGGFMDSRIDIKVMRDKSKLVELGRNVAFAVAKEYGLKRKKGAVNPVNKTQAAAGTLYRVQVGAFSKVRNAQDLASEIRKKGFQTYVVQVGNLHKVQVGAFAIKKNAEQQLKRLKNAGYKDAFITTDVTKAIPALEPLNEPEDFNLEEDGYVGPHLVKGLQSYFDLIEDGEIWGQVRNQATLAFNQKAVRYGSGGSPVVRALQKQIGAKVDGYWGVETTRALQRYLGTPVDGEVWRPSTAIKEMQRRLNAGTF